MSYHCDSCANANTVTQGWGSEQDLGYSRVKVSDRGRRWQWLYSWTSLRNFIFPEMARRKGKENVDYKGN